MKSSMMTFALSLMTLSISIVQICLCVALLFIGMMTENIPAKFYISPLINIVVFSYVVYIVLPTAKTAHKQMRGDR